MSVVVARTVDCGVVAAVSLIGGVMVRVAVCRVAAG